MAPWYVENSWAMTPTTGAGWAQSSGSGGDDDDPRGGHGAGGTVSWRLRCHEAGLYGRAMRVGAARSGVPRIAR